MTYKIDNNRIFINTTDHQDQVGMPRQSMFKHLINKIHACFLRIFCCIHRLSKLAINGREIYHDSFFTFDTFAAKIEGKVFILKKEDYFNWKKNNFPGNIANNDFSKDFLKIFEPPQVKQKENPVQNEQPQLTPIEPQVTPIEPRVQVNPVEPINQDFEAANFPTTITDERARNIASSASALADFIADHRNESDESWKKVLSITNPPIFKEAIQIFAEKTMDIGVKLALLFDKLFKSLNQDQKEALLEVLAMPAYLASFTILKNDQDWVEKVAKKLFADLTEMTLFFKEMDEKWDIGYEKEKYYNLAKALLTKFPQDSTELLELAKSNPFGFKMVLPSYNSLLDNGGTINVLLQEMPFESACSVFKGSVYHSDFTAGFGLKILIAIYKKLLGDQRQNIYSDAMIKISSEFLDELKRTEKSQKFLDELLDNYGGSSETNRQISGAITTFMNCCIIAALRRPTGEYMLTYLAKYAPQLMIIVKPLSTRPNTILEANLTIEEKKRFLAWAATNVFMKKDVEFSDVKTA